MTRGLASANALRAAARSDSGRVRGNNEDQSVCDPQHGVYAVIDGVGGHAAGEVAAAIARRVILERLARPLGTPAERVREAIALANNEIFNESEQSLAHHGMTCVLTLALVTDRLVTIGHVGDTRLYKLTANGIRKITHDHSPIGEREDAQEITEIEAMRHPRRNEVFRDIGSTPHDKDDDGFVEIVEDVLEDDCALLLCTDGLSDMVPSSVIEFQARRHAGDPQGVVDALVAAANEAGGRDNVTVVYAETAAFGHEAHTAARQPPATRTSNSRDQSSANVDAAYSSVGAQAGLESLPAKRRQRPAALAATWCAAGALLGMAAAFLLVWRLDGATAERRRTLVVGDSAGATFVRIADAMAAARPGDVVQVEPGTYKEEVVVPDGVDLVARLAGKAILVADSHGGGSWTAVSATGNTGGRIYGFRIVSSAVEPVDVGMRISGQGRRLELVELNGPMKAGIELTDATAVTIRGCLIHAAQGPGISLSGSEATIANNAFVQAGSRGPGALLLENSRQAVLTRNVFVGYGSAIVQGVPSHEVRDLLADNFIVPSEPTVAP